MQLHGKDYNMIAVTLKQKGEGYLLSSSAIPVGFSVFADKITSFRLLLGSQHLWHAPQITGCMKE